MKWILMGLGVVVGIGVAIAVIGALLPKKHRASVRVRLKQPAEAVWQTVTAFESWPSWNKAVKKMERVEDQNGHPVWLMVDRNGRMPSEIVESTPPQEDRPGRLVTRIADPKLPFGGIWTWELSPSEEGCTVSITEDGEIYNIVFRFMARFVFGYTGTAETFLKALGDKFGEPVTPVAEVG